MTKSQLPEVEVLKTLNDCDAAYIAGWMGKTYHGRDAFMYIFSGKSYVEDPKTHELHARGIIDRAGVDPGCQILVTKDRNAFCVRVLPGCECRTFDFNWQSGKDDAWNAWLARCGGREAVEKRAQVMTDLSEACEKQAWGPDRGLGHFRANALGCNPAVHRSGHAKAIILKIFDEAKASGHKALFAAATPNIPMYRYLGARPASATMDAKVVLPEIAWNVLSCTKKRQFLNERSLAKAYQLEMLEHGTAKDEMVELSPLTDEAARYMASWLAPAYSGIDAVAEVLTGVTYEENKKLHELFFEGYLKRNSICGTVCTTRDLSAVITRFRPGEVGRGLDFSFHSDRDEEWNAFIEGSGGVDAVRKRWELVTKAVTEWLGGYGKNRGTQYYRLSLVGVRRERQGQGLGRRLFEYIAKEAAEKESLLLFRCAENNVPFYEHLGCRTFEAEPCLATLRKLKGYPPKADFYRGMEWGALPA